MFNIKEVEKVCSDCGVKYKTTIYQLLNGELDLSIGKCENCRKKAYLEELNNKKSMIAEQRDRWRKNCGLTPRFIKCSFDNYEVSNNKSLKSARDNCKLYASSFPLNYYSYIKSNKPIVSLVLSSSINGVGKTHLASAIINCILDRWNGENVVCPVKIITEPEIYSRIKATYNYSMDERNTNPSEEDIIKSLLFPPLLIIDDIGKVPQNDMKFIQRTLYRIIDGRYQNLFPVILTTNLNPNSLKDYLGRDDCAILNRLTEMTNGKFIELVGESYRLKHE